MEVETEVTENCWLCRLIGFILGVSIATILFKLFNLPTIIDIFN